MGEPPAPWVLFPRSFLLALDLECVGQPESNPDGHLDVCVARSPTSRQAGQEALTRMMPRQQDVEDLGLHLAQDEADCEWGILDHSVAAIECSRGARVGCERRQRLHDPAPIQLRDRGSHRTVSAEDLPGLGPRVPSFSTTTDSPRMSPRSCPDRRMARLISRTPKAATSSSPRPRQCPAL